jgi:enoyl-[acyl-carrier protein] reductase III
VGELDYSGKRVLVTGGSGDIGRALCVAFAGQGARVALTYFSSHEGLEKTLAAVREVGGPEPVAIRANLRDKDAPAQIDREVREKLGAVDIFFSNAASGVLKPTSELRDKHWEWTMDINARAFLALTQLVTKDMEPGGRVIALTSMGSIRAIENYAAVGASKAALEALVRHFAMELGPRGITVNALSPGVVDTNALQHFPNRDQLLTVANFRTPNRRIATPKDGADVALLLASPRAAMIQGQTLVVDGGYSILA